MNEEKPLAVTFEATCTDVTAYEGPKDEISLTSTDGDGVSAYLRLPESPENGRLFRRKFRVTIQEES